LIKLFPIKTTVNKELMFTSYTGVIHNCVHKNIYYKHVTFKPTTIIKYELF